MASDDRCKHRLPAHSCVVCRGEAEGFSVAELEQLRARIALLHWYGDPRKSNWLNEHVSGSHGDSEVLSVVNRGTNAFRAEAGAIRGTLRRLCKRAEFVIRTGARKDADPRQCPRCASFKRPDGECASCTQASAPTRPAETEEFRLVRAERDTLRENLSNAIEDVARLQARVNQLSNGNGADPARAYTNGATANGSRPNAVVRAPIEAGPTRRPIAVWPGDHADRFECQDCTASFRHPTSVIRHAIDAHPPPLELEPAT